MSAIERTPMIRGRPYFDTHGVASHDLNQRSGEPVTILGRVAEELGADDVPLYRVTFDDGTTAEAFATELFTADGWPAR